MRVKYFLIALCGAILLSSCRTDKGKSTDSSASVGSLPDSSVTNETTLGSSFAESSGDEVKQETSSSGMTKENDSESQAGQNSLSEKSETAASEQNNSFAEVSESSDEHGTVTSVDEQSDTELSTAGTEISSKAAVTTKKQTELPELTAETLAPGGVNEETGQVGYGEIDPDL
ncbi:MAG: hypothetical protein IJ806_02410 [Ruminococcus sp.]|nr:hypothetical protein [Ruminococcus sp.]